MSIKCLMNGLEVNYPCSPVCALFGDCVTAFEAQKKENVRTNADRIRAMSDEELAEAFFNLCEKLNDGTLNDLSDLYCDGKNGCVDKDGNITCTPDMEKACVLRWFQQPVGEVSK